MAANKFAARNRWTGLAVGGIAVGLSIFTYFYVQSQRGPHTPLDDFEGLFKLPGIDPIVPHSSDVFCKDILGWQSSPSVQGYDSVDTLPPSAGIRGQYINTGSKDVGPDTSDHNPYIRYRQEQKRLQQQEE